MRSNKATFLIVAFSEATAAASVQRCMDAKSEPGGVGSLRE